MCTKISCGELLSLILKINLISQIHMTKENVLTLQND